MDEADLFDDVAAALVVPGKHAAGADFVMAGGMFAGHDESGGDIVEEDGIFYKDFYGMSSAVAMEKHSGGVAEYRSSEGKHVRVAYRGPIAATCVDILGGIRSTCTCLLYTSPSPRDATLSRMPSSA